jgi:hypothetical protein
MMQHQNNAPLEIIGVLQCTGPNGCGDNLDENGAPIRMRAGSGDDMMIALSLGLCKPVLRRPCNRRSGFCCD